MTRHPLEVTDARSEERIMGFAIRRGLHIEEVDPGYLVLDPSGEHVWRLEGDQVEAFELARSGVEEVPEALEQAMAGLITLGIVETNRWSRRRVLQLGGAAAAAGVAVIALPSVAAAASPGGGTGTGPTSTTSTTTTTTTTPPASVHFDESAPGTYQVQIPAGVALSYVAIGGGGGCGSSNNIPLNGRTGSDGTQITGRLAARATAYTLSVVVAGGGHGGKAGSRSDAGGGKSGGGQGGYYAGGGGGASSIEDLGAAIQIVAPGGAGGALLYAGADPTTSPPNWNGSRIAGNSGSGSGSQNGGGGGGGDAQTVGVGVGGDSGGGVDGSDGTASGGGNGGQDTSGNFGGSGGGGGLTGGGGGGGLLSDPNSGLVNGYVGGGGGGSAIATGSIVDSGAGTYPVAAATTDSTAGNGGARQNAVSVNGQDGRVTITSI